MTKDHKSLITITVSTDPAYYGDVGLHGRVQRDVEECKQRHW